LTSRILSNANKVIKHIFYLLDEDVLFYFYAPAKFAPASGTKRKGSAYMRHLRTLPIPFPQGTLPLSSPRLAVLNAGVVLICGASEHCLSPPPWHAPANFARLTVLNASFASLAFVKYRGAQIALWLEGS